MHYKKIPMSMRSALNVLLILAFIPASAAILWNGWTEYKSAIKSAEDQSLNLARSLGRFQSQIERECEVLLNTVSSLPTAFSMNKSISENALHDAISRHNVFASLFVVDAEGNRIASSRKDGANINVSSRKYFQDAKNSGVFSAGEYVVGMVGVEQSIHYALPLYTPDGAFNGVAAVQVLMNVYDSFFSHIVVPKNSRFIILDHDGIRLHRYPPREESKIGKPAIPSLRSLVSSSADEFSIVDEFDQVGDHLIYSLVRLSLPHAESPYMAIIVGIPKPTLYDIFSGPYSKQLLILFVSFVLAFVGARWITRVLIGYGIETLADATNRIGSEGDPVPVGDLVGCSEIQALGRSFDAMTEKIRTRTAEVKIAEEELFRQTRLLTSVIEGATDAIFAKDSLERYILANTETAKIVGRPVEEIIGRKDADFFPAHEAARISADDRITLDTGLIQDIELTLTTANGQKTFHTTKGPLRDDQGRITGLFGISRDITERLKIQEVMIQTEKMMSVGGLAAGMAHEINNPLSGILQNAQVLLKRLTTSSPVNVKAAEEAGCSLDAVQKFMENRDVLASLKNIREAGERATAIVASMLEFSRTDEKRRSPVDLGKLMDKAVELCATDYDLKRNFDFRRIHVVKEYDETELLVECSRTQIQQVCLNIISNAAQAMIDTPNPEITLRLKTEAGCARIEIEDNGPGMAENVSKHIFEPFFTTKPVGEGTGLGLSVCYFIIVNKHGGTLSVQSVPGKGTRFVFTLPFITSVL